jgi:hypothetical protein
MIKLRRFDFVLQFCWQATPLSKRLEKLKAPPQAAAGEVAAGGAGGAN